jgi:hypothetical protein
MSPERWAKLYFWMDAHSRLFRRLAAWYTRRVLARALAASCEGGAA